jgi:predicted alpha/beta superfamily hydrolase
MSFNWLYSFGQEEVKLDSIYSDSFESFRHFKTKIHGEKSVNCSFQTIYVFDAQNQNIFDYVNETIHFLYNEIKPILVVGVISDNRNSDFLIKSISTLDKERYGDDMGEFNKFDSFISEELVPFIEKKYSVSHERWAIGHSNGATFLLNQWLEKPQIFSARILLDPNFTFSNNDISKRIKNLQNYEQYNKSISYLCRAYYPNSPIEWSNESKIGYTALKKFYGKSSFFMFENFEENYNHYSVFSKGCHNGIKYLFDQTLFNPRYFINHILNDCESSIQKNTEVLNYMLSNEGRGYFRLANECAIIIDSNFKDIGDNYLDAIQNFNLASKFEKMKLNKSALSLYQSCSKFLEQNKNNMDKVEFEKYKNLIDSKISFLKEKL